MKIHLEGQQSPTSVTYEFLGDGRVRIEATGFADDGIETVVLDITAKEWELFQKFLQN